MKRYILTTTIYHTKKDINFYGVALIREEDDTCELIEEFNDLSENKEEVLKLVKSCNIAGYGNFSLAQTVEEFMDKQ